MKPEKPLRVLVAGLGTMGLSHALAYQANPGFETAALVNRSNVQLPSQLRSREIRRSFLDTLREIKPDVASINTYPGTHAEYCVAALDAGCHVFVEKPLAASLSDAERVVAAAKANCRKLVIGYILQHHPSWQLFIKEARRLGGPYVFHMNLNQQSSGTRWNTHKKILETMSPLVDCGVHYIDAMCQITDANPIEVRGMGLRLTEEVPSGTFNYGHLQVLFANGSVGWYESGWGPMISGTAFFVKDVISPKGSISIVVEDAADSSDIDNALRTSKLRVHLSDVGADGNFVAPDTFLSMVGEPNHQELCESEQAFLLQAIREDTDLTRHHADAVNSLAVCIAADTSILSRHPIRIQTLL